MFTARQYRPHQKRDFLKTFPRESRAAADLLAQDLKHLAFAFASVFHQPGGILAGVRIEFKTREDGKPVWVDVTGDRARLVLDGRGRRIPESFL